jgi:hypothetical protein
VEAHTASRPAHIRAGVERPTAEQVCVTGKCRTDCCLFACRQAGAIYTKQTTS